MRKMLGIAAMAGLLVSGTSAIATAAPKDEGSCPPSMERLRVNQVLKYAAPGFEDVIKGADENGNNNGYLCFRLLENVDRFDPYPTFHFGDDSEGFGSGQTAND